MLCVSAKVVLQLCQGMFHLLVQEDVCGHTGMQGLLG